jgi:uncharacterized protein YecA (UPF0149 family)
MNSDHPKIQTLLTLDQPSNTRKWPDYLGEYGFNEQDVPALLALFADEGLDALQTMNDSEIQELQQSIRPRLAKLYRPFSRPQKFTKATFVRAAPKVGRSQSCPCGSGKKYNKCCALN